MSSLWEKDIFSDSRMIFSDTSEGNIKDVSEIISHHYGSKVVNVSQSGAFEANSNNFLVRCADGNMIAKRINVSNRNVDFLREQFHVANELYQLGINIPKIIHTNSGEIFARNGNSIWCVLEFIDGYYLSGAEEEMISAIKLLDQVFIALSGMPKTMKLPKMNLLGNSSLNVLAFLDADMEVRKLQNILDEISNNMTQLESMMGLCHIDFHPHNLIVSDGKVFVIDFDSLMYAPIKSMLSFGALKLIRHAMAYEGGFDTGLRNRLWGYFSKSNMEILSMHGAQAEVFRRLLSILDTTSPGNRDVWRRLIPVHVRCILEAEEIFDGR